MSNLFAQKIASSLSLQLKQVQAVLSLIKEGATIPFMARYRKELTGSLDELQLGAIRDRLEKLQALEERKASILKSLKERDILAESLVVEIQAAESLSVLEDIYHPYRLKRRSKASVAMEQGLEGLAEFIFNNQHKSAGVEARKYLGQSEEIKSCEDAIAGALFIIAEWISDSLDARKEIRSLFKREAILSSKLRKGKEQEGNKFKDYFDWKEPLSRAAPHRVLAIRRAVNDGILSATIRPDEEKALYLLSRSFVRAKGENGKLVSQAIADAYKRLIRPAIESEFTKLTKEKADLASIKVFSDNLRELLLASPLGQKRVLAIDPGFRTGCKLVCLGEQGQLLESSVIYPTGSASGKSSAEKTLKHFLQKYSCEAIAIGNGTASRETESFVRSVVKDKKVQVVVVNESGASIYSASELAREEFPDQDITVRGTVSIGRRLMDPLAELVKLDPKSIGVGQYQHDVDQKKLLSELSRVVESCVNSVGVELNTASAQLLSAVSGLNSKVATNIIDFRNESGAFRSRKELLKVKGLGKKAFEQSAGFLRIRGAKNPLDSSAVHPESYSVVKQMAGDLSCSITDLLEDSSLRSRIDLNRYVSDSIGLPSLKDILGELEKPGRDPRKQFEAFSFAENIVKPEDLVVGQRYPGIVSNVAAFGAFVDLGVHQDGLVHVSQLSDSFVKDPNEIVKVGQRVQVRVVEVDLQRKRIALSMKSDSRSERPQQHLQKQGISSRSNSHKAKGRKQSGGDNWFDQALKNKGL